MRVPRGPRGYGASGLQGYQRSTTDPGQSSTSSRRVPRGSRAMGWFRAALRKGYKGPTSLPNPTVRYDWLGFFGPRSGTDCTVWLWRNPSASTQKGAPHAVGDIT